MIGRRFESRAQSVSTGQIAAVAFPLDIVMITVNGTVQTYGVFVIIDILVRTGVHFQIIGGAGDAHAVGSAAARAGASDTVSSGTGEIAHLLGTGSGFAPRPRTASLAGDGISGSPAQGGVLAAFDLAGIIKIHRRRIVTAVLRARRLGFAALTTAVAARIAF